MLHAIPLVLTCFYILHKIHILRSYYSSFEIREEPRRSWGLETNGVFSGMMGQLQREEVDFCTEAAPTPERLTAIEYARGYPSDIMVVTSLKPSLLPQHLALVRPFSSKYVPCIRKLYNRTLFQEEQILEKYSFTIIFKILMSKLQNVT